MTESALLDRRRAQLGASILPWPTGDAAVTRVGAGWWLVLSGTPSPDGNIGLVFAEDAGVLREVAAEVEQTGHPTLLMTAGDTPHRALPAPWQDVCSMPFMTAELADTPRAYDPRVRQALPSDLGTVVDLLVETYGMQPEIATAVVAPILHGNGPIDFWLLEDRGAAVSTVMTARYEDVVTIWCMATRPRRRPARPRPRRRVRRRSHGGPARSHAGR